VQVANSATASPAAEQHPEVRKGKRRQKARQKTDDERVAPTTGNVLSSHDMKSTLGLARLR
jgi:hypothetical protein